MYIAGEPVAFRGLEPSDFGFIVQTWCVSTRRIVCGVGRDLFAASSKAACVLAMAHGDWVIACCPDMPSTVYGWVCFAPNVDDKNIWNQNTSPIYGFVQKAVRGRGLFRAMRGHYEDTCKRRGDTRPNETRGRFALELDGDARG